MLLAATDELLDAVRLAAAIIRPHNLTPESWLCRLTAGDVYRHWCLTATNFETTVRVRTAEYAEGDFSALLPVKTLLPILDLADADEVVVSDGGATDMTVGYTEGEGGKRTPVLGVRDAIRIRVGSAEYWVQRTTLQHALRTFETRKPAGSVESKAGILRGPLAAVLPLIPKSDDEHTYNLKAVCLDYDPRAGRLAWVAGSPLFFGVAATVPYAGDWQDQVIVPVKAAKLFSQALERADAEAPCRLDWGRLEVRLAVEPHAGRPGVDIVTKVMDGRFMPWQRMAEAKLGDGVELSWSDFLRAHRLALTAGDDIRIRFKPAGLNLEVEGQAIDPVGRAKTRGRAATQTPLRKAAKAGRRWCFGESSLEWVRKLGRQGDDRVTWYGSPDQVNRVVFPDGLVVFVCPIPEAE